MDLCIDLGGEEILAEDAGGTKEEVEFDRVVGALQEILLDDNLSRKQRDFLDRHCHQFEDSAENKLEYTGIFNQYTEMIESVLEQELGEKLPGFSMVAFSNMLAIQPPEELSGDVFDMLNVLDDFEEFKALMLSHKAGQYVGTLEPSSLQPQSELTIIGSPLRSPVGSPDRK